MIEDWPAEDDNEELDAAICRVCGRSFTFPEDMEFVGEPICFVCGDETDIII